MQAGPHASPGAAAGVPESDPAAPPPGRPPRGGPVGVSALLAAVRAVPGVRDAQVRTSADGDRTLRLDLADGADGLTVAALVSQVLDERLGVVVDPTRSFMVEDAAADEETRVPVDGPRRRVLMERMQVVTGGLDASVDVGLASAEAKVVGTASGPAVEAAVIRTVATATLNAVDALLGERGRCGLDQAEITEIGTDRVAVAVVTLLTPGRVDRLAGAALVRGDARQAMARAILAALNRRLESLLPEFPARAVPERPAADTAAAENAGPDSAGPGRTGPSENAAGGNGAGGNGAAAEGAAGDPAANEGTGDAGAEDGPTADGPDGEGSDLDGPTEDGVQPVAGPPEPDTGAADPAVAPADPAAGPSYPRREANGYPVLGAKPPLPLWPYPSRLTEPGQ